MVCVQLLVAVKEKMQVSGSRIDSAAIYCSFRGMLKVAGGGEGAIARNSNDMLRNASKTAPLI